jgi:hypothetical protein
MKKYLKYIPFIVFFITGCASPAVRHTKYQQKMEERQTILTEDAKGFIVKATKMLTVQSGTVDINRVKDLLLKSQSLLDVDVDDGKELENLNGAELDKKTAEIYENGQKEKNTIADLKKRDEEEISKMISNSIESDVIKRYERAKTIKWCAIGGSILAVLGGLFYIFPGGFLRFGGSIVSFLFRR